MTNSEKLALQRAARERANVIRETAIAFKSVPPSEQPDPFASLEVVLRHSNLPYALDAYVRQEHAKLAA